MSHRTSHHRPPQHGFTLVEILVVIVILGILATVTVFAVSGIRDKGETASCRSDRATIVKAADYYLGQHNLAEIPASGADDDRFERTLIDEQLLRDVSIYHDLQADGTVVSTGQPCP